jgi:hypothetical protein
MGLANAVYIGTPLCENGSYSYNNKLIQFTSCMSISFHNCRGSQGLMKRTTDSGYNIMRLRLFEGRREGCETAELN